MPEYTLPGGNEYVYTAASFWTSGFFPSSIYLLYERRAKWPQVVGDVSDQPTLQPDVAKLQSAARWWSQNLHAQAHLTDTHDLGFLIFPWARLGWELDGSEDCYHSMLVAAHGLAARFDPRVGCIRSWDTCFTKRYAFADPKEDFLVIIDNMMSSLLPFSCLAKHRASSLAADLLFLLSDLELMYYVADLTKDPRLARIATSHAHKTLESHIRPDNSTCHVVNFEQTDGSVKQRMTNQGYSDESCWSRGQAWGITGFAQCYKWTAEPKFLEASKALADYFLTRLPPDGVPFWDFDAPEPAPRDTSAAMVAAYGMLLLFEAERRDNKKYYDAAMRIVSGVVRTSLSPEARFLVTPGGGGSEVDLGGHDTILLHATINNYEFAPRRWADRGLVYADYYFILFGNKLLELGLA